MWRLVTIALCGVFAAAGLACAEDLNTVILRQIREMPEGGGYMAGGTAAEKLARAVRVEDGRLVVDTTNAMPSFCSSATYLVFLKAVGEQIANGGLALDANSLKALAVKGQQDGHGIWGRWNANGPGTARFFHELGLGENFTDWDRAKAGDFLKIFWTNEIGARERGHSVIFLGMETIDGKPAVRFWSSNQNAGYGEKVVPLSRVKLAVFSRFSNAAALARVANLPQSDAYLASMLSRRSSVAELKEKCGIPK